MSSADTPESLASPALPFAGLQAPCILHCQVIVHLLARLPSDLLHLQLLMCLLGTPLASHPCRPLPFFLCGSSLHNVVCSVSTSFWVLVANSMQCKVSCVSCPAINTTTLQNQVRATPKVSKMYRFFGLLCHPAWAQPVS